MEGTSTRPAAPAQHSSPVSLTADRAAEIAEDVVERLPNARGVSIHGCGHESACRIVSDQIQQTVELYVSRATPSPTPNEPGSPTLADVRPVLLSDDVAAITSAVQERIARILNAGPAQSSQIRLELTELESRVRRLTIELLHERENRDNLAAAYRVYRNKSARTRQLLAEQLEAARSRQSEATAVDWQRACRTLGDGTSQADPMVIDDSGSSFAELNDMATRSGGPG